MNVANASREIDGEPRRSSPAICHFHWGHLRRAAGAVNMGKVQEVFSPPPLFFGWGFCLALLRPRFARTPFFPVRFYAQRHRPNGDSDWKVEWRDTEEDKRRGKEHRGPSAGWGSSLCCWSGCHITPCGDDCAIYCLAGAGDLRRRNQTGSTRAHCVVCKQNKLNGVCH